MFTNDSRRNHAAAAVITFAAAAFLVSTVGLAAPKRDVGNGNGRKGQDRIVEIGHPSTPPNSGGHDITVGAMKKQDTNLTPDTFEAGSFVRIVTPSPFPTGSGNDVRVGAVKKDDAGNGSGNGRKDSGRIVEIGHPSTPPNSGGHDIAVDAMKKQDMSVTPDPFEAGSFVRIVTPSPFPTGSGQDITVGALSSQGEAAAASTPSRSFVQALDLSSGGRWVGGSSSLTAPSRNPFADGRAWVAVARDDQGGLTAAAGWSFLLK